MNKKFLIYPILTVALGFSAVSCSSDDDDNDGPSSGTPVDMPIPSSVVDGVRVSDIQGSASISYNADGSIKDATYNGTTYKFEYEGSRAAASTGRKLVRIVAVDNTYEDEGHYEKWEATNFKFNSDGFIVAYYETSEEGRRGHWWEKISLDISVDYNNAGRISTMSIAGTYEGYDEDEGKYKGKDKAKVKYTYSGDNLISSVVDDPEGSISYTFDYSAAPDNAYNIVTPHLGAGMAMYSPIPYIFATAGYLGNASAQLPTKLTYKYIDKEDPEYNETDVYNITYSLDANNRINSISPSNSGGGYSTMYFNYIVQ